MKKGGTSSGNVAIPPAKKMRTNVGSLNNDHSMKTFLRIRVRSLIRSAAGIPVASCSIPIIQNVQAIPSRAVSPLMMKEMIDPPSPPPAKTIPFARPRLREKYCAGSVDTVTKHKLTPIPRVNPAVAKSPPTLCVTKPANSSPALSADIPSNPVHLGPTRCNSLALKIASPAFSATAKLPMKLSVDAEASPS